MTAATRVAAVGLGLATLLAPAAARANPADLVGFGARVGSGCTSGHGVCGIGRLSLRSIVATTTFILTGAVAFEPLLPFRRRIDALATMLR